MRDGRAAGAALPAPGTQHGAVPAGFSLFPRDAEEDGEDAIILLLKRAKVRLRAVRAARARGPAVTGPVSPQLSAMKGELAEAERFLHQALRRAHQEENRQAIIYTYSMVSARDAPRRGEKEKRLSEARPPCLGGA